MGGVKRSRCAQGQSSGRQSLDARKRRWDPMSTRPSSGQAGLYGGFGQAHRHQGRSTYGKVRP